jgi:Replication-relaxation
MRLTKRCEDLLHLLRAARWLTTSQVHRRFFQEASRDAARKRLRKLTQAEYLVKFREHGMSEALFALGPEGKRMLELGGEEIILERKPPKQLPHVIGVNDLRIAAELAGPVSYFFSYWELPDLGWRYPVIPDAVFSLRGRTFALEFDRGLEGVRFFMNTKIKFYRRGLEGFPLSAILVVADRKPRMLTLARAISNAGGQFLFSTLEEVKKHGLLAAVFRPHAEGGAGSLLAGSLAKVSSRQETFSVSRGTESTT